MSKTNAEQPEVSTRCPECNGVDFDTNRKGTEGYCFTCGTAFAIHEDGSTTETGEMCPVCPV